MQALANLIIPSGEETPGTADLEIMGESALRQINRLVVARLSGAAWTELERAEPALATRLALGLAAALGAELDRLAADMGLLIAGRSLPRAQEIVVRVLGEEYGASLPVVV